MKNIRRKIQMINVFYAGNKRIFDMILVSTLSMAKTASEPLCIYIVTMDLSEQNPKYVPISEEQVEFLDGLVKQYNKESKVIRKDVTDIYKTHIFESKNNLDRFTPYALLRIFADYYDFPDKIIYLDIDTVINNDIAELFNQDIENYEVGVVRDVFILGQKLHKTYFNSGMLLMNMKKIKETGHLQKTRDLCKVRKMIFLDQDALNYSVTYKKMLDRKFNSIHVPHHDYSKVVVHHMCDCRHHIFFRYKSKDFDTVKKYMPYYAPLIDEVLELKKQTDLL
jgi:lipopolysaccharide biosynthesis glycosyltransferase